MCQTRGVPPRLYLGIRGRASQFILSFLMVGLPFPTGLAALVPVVPGDTWQTVKQ